MADGRDGTATRQQITKNKSTATATTKAKAGRQTVTLYVCRSCVWSEAKREQDGKRQGEFLLAAIKQIILHTPLPKNAGLRAVHCLSGCKSPCNVAFRSAGKFGLRFSRLTPDNASDVLAFLDAYNDSDAGDVPEAEIPPSMRANLTARTPPPPIRSK